MTNLPEHLLFRTLILLIEIWGVDKIKLIN